MNVIRGGGEGGGLILALELLNCLDGLEPNILLNPIPWSTTLEMVGGGVKIRIRTIQLSGRVGT